MEDQLIKKIKGGILGMRNGTKHPKEVAPLLNKLKPLNVGMFEELMNDYKKAFDEFVKKNEDK